MSEGIVSLIAGAVLLFAGRRFFWLAAGLVAFLFTVYLINLIFNLGWFGILIGLVVGVIFGWLAVKFVKIAGYFIGAIAGAFIIPTMLGILGVDITWWLGGLIGGVIGLVMMIFLFDWGFILLTALMGASAVANDIQDLISLEDWSRGLLALVLFILGVIVQSRQKK